MVDIQVRCTLRSANGVEADNAVNTFAVTGATPGTDDATIASAFEDFYSAAAPGAAGTIGRFINDTIFRTDGLRIELISTPQAPPNAPYFMTTVNLPASGASDALVQEAAVCLSFVTGDYLTSLTPGRERGRVYIGPLNELAAQDGGVLDVLRPSDAIETDLALAATELKSTLAVAEWAIWSRAAGTFTRVDSGWIDNEFDTQRRRGRERTSRVIWP